VQTTLLSSRAHSGWAEPMMVTWWE